MGSSNWQENTGTKSTLFWLCRNSVTSAFHIMRWSVLTFKYSKLKDASVQYLESRNNHVPHVYAYKHTRFPDKPMQWTNKNRMCRPMLRGPFCLGMTRGSCLFLHCASPGLLCCLNLDLPLCLPQRGSSSQLEPDAVSNLALPGCFSVYTGGSISSNASRLKQPLVLVK